jgi:hypothetical protein
MNLLFFSTIAIAYALFWGGTKVWQRDLSRARRVVVSVFAGGLALPGVMFAVYYLHLFDNAAWFYQYRSLPFTELTAGGAGLLAGMITAATNRHKLFSRSFVLAMLTIGIMVPYVKPILAPIPPDQIHDEWVEDVCLQSSPYSCGPASTATLFRAAGIDLSETEIVRLCYTSKSGTENWYLARLFRSRGFDVRFRTGLDPSGSIPVPSIVGVKLVGAGHFIPIIAETATTYITGDPLQGRREWPKHQLHQRYKYTGFFMEIRNPTSVSN